MAFPILGGPYAVVVPASLCLGLGLVPGAWLGSRLLVRFVLR